MDWIRNVLFWEILVHTFQRTTQQAKAGRALWGSSLSHLQSEFQDSQHYTEKPCLKKQNKKPNKIFSQSYILCDWIQLLRLFWEAMETPGSWRHTGGSGHLGQVNGPILSFATSCLVFWLFCCPWSEHGQQKETVLHHPFPELKCLRPSDTRLTSLKPLIKTIFPH